MDLSKEVDYWLATLKKGNEADEKRKDPELITALGTMQCLRVRAMIDILKTPMDITAASKSNESALAAQEEYQQEQIRQLKEGQ